MGVNIALFKNDKIILGHLTKIFTGSYVYHIAFITDDGWIYEMNLKGLLRKRITDVSAGTKILIYKVPVDISEDYLIHRTLEQKEFYGFLDYLMFGIRCLGIKLRFNGKGLICSEYINQVLWKFGYKTPWKPKIDSPPSPADFERLFLTRGLDKVGEINVK